MSSTPDTDGVATDAEPAITPEAVTAALDSVYDPELDRSLAELQYVRSIDIEGDLVDLQLHLPTGLCSPAFAWMMVADAREAVLDLPGVTSVDVRLTDHVFDDEISDGVNAGRRFDDVFEDAEADVDALRERFDEKARLGRAYDAIETLLEAGLSPTQIATLTFADLSLKDRAALFALDGLTVTVPAEPIEAYLEKVRALELDRGSAAPVFRDPDREPIDPDAFETVRRRFRLANTNMDGQAHQCSLLLEARYGIETDVDGAP